jgi:hypothetical protein
MPTMRLLSKKCTRSDHVWDLQKQRHIDIGFALPGAHILSKPRLQTIRQLLHINFRHPCVYNYKITVCIVMFILSCNALTWSQKRKHITSMSVLSWVHRLTLNQQPKSLMCSSLPLVPKNPDSSQKPFRRLECSFPLPVLKKPPQALHVFKITRMILICERLASTK